MTSIKISGLTEQTTASDTDLLPVASSAGTAKRMTLANFVKWLAGKFAPAGYGLGGCGKTVHISYQSDLDDIEENGWYSIIADTGILFDGVAYLYDCMLEVSMVNEYSGMQTLKWPSGLITYRSKENEWYPWVWVNPPMSPGGIHRTTEIYDDLPVYVRTFSIGTLAYGSGKIVDGVIPPDVEVISISGFMYLEDDGATVSLPSNANIVVTTGGSVEAYLFNPDNEDENPGDYNIRDNHTIVTIKFINPNE